MLIQFVNHDFSNFPKEVIFEFVKFVFEKEAILRTIAGLKPDEKLSEK